MPPEYRLYPNVAWLGRTAEHRGLRDGEADIVLAHRTGASRSSSNRWTQSLPGARVPAESPAHPAKARSTALQVVFGMSLGSLVTAFRSNPNPERALIDEPGGP